MCLRCPSWRSINSVGQPPRATFQNGAWPSRKKHPAGAKMSHTGPLLWQGMPGECLYLKPWLTYVCFNETSPLQQAELVGTRSPHSTAGADLGDLLPSRGEERIVCSLLPGIAKCESFLGLFYHGDTHWPIFDILHDIHVSVITRDWEREEDREQKDRGSEHVSRNIRCTVENALFARGRHQRDLV